MKKISVAVAVMFAVSSLTGTAHAAQPMEPRVKPEAVSLQSQVTGLKAQVRKMQAAPGRIGETGPRGESGPAGLNGQSGQQGLPGRDGQPGGAGKNGVDGKNGIDGKDGAAGVNGVDGTNGRDGTDGMGLPSGTVLLIGGDCPSGTTVQGTAYQWRVYSGNPFTGTGSELWVSACRVN